MALAFRSFQSTRLLLVLAALAILAVVLLLAAPHLVTFVHSFSGGSRLLSCGTADGGCPS